MDLPTSAQRTFTFNGPEQLRIWPVDAQVDRFFLRGKVIECAVDQQQHIFCGYSAIAWSTFENKELNPVSSLEDFTSVDKWFRRIRQNRFSVTDQTKLTTIIDRACLEFDSLRQAHQAQGNPDPDQDAANNLVAIYSSGVSRLCTSMGLGAHRPECWAQAFDGCKLKFKDKCTMCKAVFHLRTVQPDSLQLAKRFAEQSSKEYRGMCAEALVHAQLYNDNNISWS